MPLGEFSVGVEVRDTQTVTVSSLVADCNLDVQSIANSRIDSSTICTSLKNDFVASHLAQHTSLMSKRSQYVYVLQTVQTSLLYIHNNMDDDCSYSLFADSIELLSQYFNRNATSLCESDHVVVCGFHL